MAAPFVSDGFADGREFAEWCDAMRDLHGRGVSAYGVRVSWSPDELDAGDPEDVRRAMEYGVCLAARFAPSMPVHVVAHGDGEGGCLHLHLEFANTDPETGRAFSGPRNHRALKKCADELAEEMAMCVLKEPKKRGRGQTWAAKSLDPSTSAFERELGGRVWSAYSEARSVAEFKELLAASGVEVVENVKRRKNPSTGKREAVTGEDGAPVVSGWSFKMRDPESGRVRRRKASGLAAEFARDRAIAEFERRAAEAERQRREAERRRRAEAAAEQREREEAARDLNAIAVAVGERAQEPAVMSLRLDLAVMTPERFEGAFRESLAPGAASGRRESQPEAREAAGNGLTANYGLAGAPASRRPSSAPVSLLARLLALLREARLAARRLMRRDVTEGERVELARRCLRDALPEPPKPRQREPQREQVQEAVPSVELPSRRRQKQRGLSL